MRKLTYFLSFSFQRPAWSTGTLIPLSFLCGIGAAVFIAHGGKKTKRTREIEDKLRAVLAMERPRRSQQGNSNLTEDHEDTTVTHGANIAPPTKAKASRTISPSLGDSEKPKGGEHDDLEIAVDEHMTVPSAVDVAKQET